MRRSRSRLDLVEVSLYTALVVVATLAVRQLTIGADASADLKARFGPSHWSQGPEEWIVRDYFNDRRGGVFVDVGAADPRAGSNTYFLESALGWSGVAIDAQREYAEAYRRYRPGSQFFSFFVADRSDETAVLFVDQDRPGSSSATRDFTETYSPGGAIERRQVPTITLDDLLPRAGIDHIDFLSMDIEMSEPQALAGFDLARYRPVLICIEPHWPTAQWLLDYFGGQGYTPVAKYLVVDATNYWFMPRDTRR